MAIEFPCPSCNTLIRTPEGTEGKPARCPNCSTIVVVPGGAAGPALGSSLPSAALPSTFPQSLNPPAQPPETNPFAEKSATALNPYAAPANPFAHDPFQALSPAELDQRASSRLLIPAIGMIVFAVTGLGFMAMVGLAVSLDPNLLRGGGQDPAEARFMTMFFGSYFALGFLSRALQILGAIAMLRRRGYGLAMTGAICALTPCEFYCCIPSLPFGIWALMVLNNAEVKAAFSRVSGQ